MQHAAGDDPDEEDQQPEQGAQCLGVDLHELQAAEQQPELAEPGDEQDPDVCWVLEENWQALRLFMACRHQLELVLGMGGGVWRPARTLNVARELDWLDGIAPADQADVVARYRVIEAEMLRLLNQQLHEQN